MKPELVNQNELIKRRYPQKAVYHEISCSCEMKT